MTLLRSTFWSPGHPSHEAPPVPFVPALMRRRLSQLSRMVAFVVHEVAAGEQVKISFSSEYGEIGQQYAISKEIVETSQVSPTRFSVSVFNSPVAATSIIERNTAGYTAVSAGKNSFAENLRFCKSALASGELDRILLVHADELLPEPYQPLAGGANTPYALAWMLQA
jgi:hypothetical protein